MAFDQSQRNNNDALFSDSIYTDYHDLFSDVFNNGSHHADTYALYGVTYVVPVYALNKMNERNHVYMPEWRGDKRTSIDYARDESRWYALGTNNVSEIAHKYKFWNRMADPKAQTVNSNYGYQLRVTPGPKTARAFAEELVKNGEATSPLMTPLAMVATHDVPCNMQVHAKLRDVNNTLVLDMSSFARSIDLTFGLPYDQYMLQLLGYAICEELEKLLDRPAILHSCIFRIANVHIYERDVNALVLGRNANERRAHTLMAIEADSALRVATRGTHERPLTTRARVVKSLNALGASAYTQFDPDLDAFTRNHGILDVATLDALGAQNDGFDVCYGDDESGLHEQALTDAMLRKKKNMPFDRQIVGIHNGRLASYMYDASQGCMHRFMMLDWPRITL